MERKTIMWAGIVVAVGMLSLVGMAQTSQNGGQEGPVVVVGQVMTLTQWNGSLYLQLDLNADAIGDIWVKVTPRTAVYDMAGDSKLTYADIKVGDYVEITKYFWNERLRYCEALQLRTCLCDGECDECQQLRERCQNAGDLQQLKKQIQACTQTCTSEPKHDQHQYNAGDDEKKGSGKGKCKRKGGK